VGFFAKSDGLISDQSVMQALDGREYAALDQVHGSRTVLARSGLKRTEKADGLITDQEGLVLTLRIADCQPIVVYAPEANVIGVIHAGWKGLLSGVIPQFFHTLQATWDVKPECCLVGVGPCLCTSCAEFSDPLLELPGIPRDLLKNNTADLRSWADRQIVSTGVRPENIERIPDCTRCDPQTYWTYRGGDREAVKSGRTNVMACVLK
jgi:YfiH family protein